MKAKKIRAPRDVRRQTTTGVVRCCKDCGTWFPEDAKHFYRDCHGRYNVYCKVCTKARSAAYRPLPKPKLPEVLELLRQARPYLNWRDTPDALAERIDATLGEFA